MPIIHSDQSSGSGVHVKWPRVSGFTLLEPLYEGSSCALYRARQDRLGRVVALKLLPEWPPPTDVALERFNRAAYVYAQTPHPQLVTLYETGTKDGYHYLTLEYVAGQTLQKHLSQMGNSDERFAMDIAENVLKALVALHGRDICHRNLKPKNIFIESNGKVRVLGLGLASCKSAFFSAHLDARPIGTPHFMAPEMIRGSYSDPRSDLYSLGVTLYVMSTGRPPFEKGSPLAVMSRHLTDLPAPMAEIRPDLSREFIQFVHTLMSREPEQRFQTARDALEHCQALVRRHDSPPRLIPEILFGAPKLNGVQLAGMAVQPRLLKLLRSAALVAASAVATLLILAGLFQVTHWVSSGKRAAPAAAPAAPAINDEDAEFFRLIELNSTFVADPASGAEAWAGYLEKFPHASAIHRSRAKARLEAMLRHPKPEARRENPEF